MKTFHCNIRICSAFATPLVGDTLFGQLCWAVRQRHGEAMLTTWLEGYTEGKPFVVVGNPYPAGHLPRPTVPQFLLSSSTTTDARLRKQQKGLRWMPIAKSSLPLHQWLEQGLCNDQDILVSASVNTNLALESQALHQHNSLNRLTNTTGKGDGFAPYSQTRIWYHPELTWQVTVVLDDERLTPEQCHQLFIDIGMTGYGRDASSGLGKFEVLSFEPVAVQSQPANSYIALAPIALCEQQWNEEQSFYQTKVRFGRHGNVGVHQGNPFKKPVLLADAGALLQTKDVAIRLFAGSGLTGVSEVIPNTVHQGYAPLYPVQTGSSA